MIKSVVTKVVTNHVCRHRTSRLTRGLLSFSNLIRRAYYNSSNHDIATNGESRLLELNRQIHQDDQAYIIFDVGANEGEWSRIASSKCNTSQVHAFEIVPDTFGKLQANLEGIENVTLRNVGLSDEEKEVEINFYPEQNSGSSLYRLPWSVSETVVRASCMKGDDYMDRNDIPRVQFLKIDAEGMDYFVLAGFSRSLSQQRIDAIQFEYNAAAVLSKRFLKDFYELLEGFGYSIGRILPNAVDFKEYSLFDDENLMQSNFFAVRNQLRDQYEKS